jgi:phage tail sheath protein FI
LALQVKGEIAMPVTPTYPGVYIEEIPSGVRTITGVATSITAFIGRAQRGPTDEPITINGFGDFERIFGGMWAESKLGYAVRDFYLNGGARAIIVRLFNAQPTNGGGGNGGGGNGGGGNGGGGNGGGGNGGGGNGDAAPAVKPAYTPVKIDDLAMMAAYPGRWGEKLRATLDINVSQSMATALGLARTKLFNLTVRDTAPGGRVEQFRNVTLDKDSVRRLDKVLDEESRLVRWVWPTTELTMAKLAAAYTAEENLLKAEKTLADKLKTNPDADVTTEKAAVKSAQDALATALADLDDPVGKAEKALAAALKANPKADVSTLKTALDNALKAIATSDGLELTEENFIGAGKEGAKEGLYSLEKADLFNILCIPPYLAATDGVDDNVVTAAAAYCEIRRAMFLVDPPSNWIDKDTAKNQIDNLPTNSKNSAIFFPRLRQPDPLRDNQKGNFAPSGAVAGIFARTDTQRGVWKAPAGLEATLVGVPELSVPLTDPENGELNPLGINCLRVLPPAGRVVWGARTRVGDDRLASEWKYIPVRRTALFIEESLYRGLQWVVFEPNDEPLWAQIRLNVGAFMNNLFRQGAFQGQTPREAYFVKCDRETTPQDQINLGIVNVLVGFAPLKPAEFVIVKIQQMAGQIAT